MFGLDRKQMEAERLARLSTKRKATTPEPITSPKSSRASPKRLRVEGPKPAIVSAKKPEHPTAKADAHGNTRTPAASSDRSALRFAKPTILRTHSPWHDTTPGITFASLVEKTKLRTAVFSSFQWDLDWLFANLDMKKTNMVLVMGVRSKQEERQYQADMQAQGLNNVRLCFPQLALEGKGHSIMHSKLMVLFYEGHMRLVVSTANLVDYDWGEGGGFMENHLVVVDLPRRLDSGKAESTDLPMFGKQLREYLICMGVQDNVLDGMLNFNYDPVDGLGLVYGAFQETTPDRADVGVASLASTISQLNLTSTPESLHINYVTASLGMLDDKLLDTITAAAAGDLTKNLASPPSRASSGDLRVYFPTEKSVKNSLGGLDSGGTICAQKKLYATPKYRRDVMRDYQSSRSGMLSHSKLLFARGQPGTTQGQNGSSVNKSDVNGAEPRSDWHSWVYIGSANLTASAWGNYTKKGFVCRNWECGVVVPGKKLIGEGVWHAKQEDSETEDEDDSGHAANASAREAQSTVDMSVPSLQDMFEGVIEIPMGDIDKKYEEGDRPWFFHGHRG